MFSDAHQRIYFHSEKSERAIEIVALRIGATVRTGEVPSSVAAHHNRRGAPDNAPLFDGVAWVACDRRPLSDLASKAGTCAVPAGWSASIDAQSNLILAKEPDNAR